MVEICHHYAEPITTHRTEKKILIIYLPQHCNMALTRKALPFPLFASQHEMKLARWRQMAQQPTADWLKYFVHVGKFRTSILIGSGQNTLATVTVQDSNLSLVGVKGWGQQDRMATLLSDIWVVFCTLCLWDTWHVVNSETDIKIWSSTCWVSWTREQRVT